MLQLYVIIRAITQQTNNLYTIIYYNFIYLTEKLQLITLYVENQVGPILGPFFLNVEKNIDISNIVCQFWYVYKG